jgi:hypothetical protein
MNTANMDKLIAHMEAMPDEAFDMGRWLTGPLRHMSASIVPDPVLAAEVIEKQRTTGGCGTVACIAGEAAIIAIAEGMSVHYDSVWTIAESWLELTNTESASLFVPRTVGAQSDVTKAQAIAVLKDFRATGLLSGDTWERAGVELYEE